MKLARTIVLASSASAIGFAAPAMAQDYGAEIPAEYQNVPVEYAREAAPVANDGVETVTRTRWIRREAPMQAQEAAPHQYDARHNGYPQHSYAAYPVTYDSEAWLEECYARTRGASKKEKGGIIGALLGAIGGGIIGNRAWDSERLAGTLIGGGVGGLAGLAIGSAIGGREDKDRYDCDAALDRYMSGTSYPMDRMASRAIPAPGQHYGYAPTYAPVYAYAPVMAYAAPQQVTMIEMREEIPQQVIVRENVREEWVEEMGTQRVIEDVMVPAPAPAPRPIPIKRRPSKLQPIKGY